MSNNQWLVDRSRYEAGFRCPRLRFLNYHAGPEGKGYQPKEGKIPLLRGIWVHEGLAKICEVIAAGDEVTDDIIRMAASFAVTGYRKDANTAGVLTDVPPEHFDFTVNEQAALVEGLVWAWTISMLPIFKSELEIISVEREEHFLLPIGSSGVHVTPRAPATECPRCGKDAYNRSEPCIDKADLSLRFMSKPDILVRTKSGVFGGQVGLGDWKTKESRINEWWIRQWRDSIQMATGSLAAERRLGEPVSHYYLFGLQVGGRERFARAGQTTPEERQYSHLCYARIHPPNPPFEPEIKLEFKGYWHDKQPTWEAHFPDKDPNQTNMEYLVKYMPKKILDEIFIYAGPYERQETLIQSIKQEIQGNEISWINKLHDLHERGNTEEALNQLFPRSYQCFYGRHRCGFYGPCREGKDWEDFKVRVPHHKPEEKA